MLPPNMQSFRAAYNLMHTRYANRREAADTMHKLNNAEYMDNERMNQWASRSVSQPANETNIANQPI